MEIYSHARNTPRSHTASNVNRSGIQHGRGIQNGSNTTKQSGAKHNQNNENVDSGNKLIQTLTACYRCRQRKTKCDVGLPKCGPCQRARPPIDCKFWDAERETFLSRSYIVSLQQKAKELEIEYRRRTASSDDPALPSVEELVRSMGLVSLADEEPEPHYLGSSAGLQLARLVVEFAKERTRNHSVEDIVPSSEHESAKEQGKERRPSFPALSAQPMGKLPNRDVADRLIEEFIFKRAQFMLPTLHEPSFMALVDDIYAGSQDSYQNFAFKIVIAISMQKLGTQYSALADSYYLAALLHLEDVISLMNLDTLQCFCLMGQYSLLTPTRTGIYHIIGLATRLCIDLGLHQEKTIRHDENGVPYDPLTLDMRRRLFWVTMSMESGLSHILGRPSGFCTGDYFTDVEFYEPVDDARITKDKVMTGPHTMKKLMSMHFFRMRILQAEIRRTLYQNPRPSPKSDSDPWFKEMYAKLDTWYSVSLLTEDRFQHRYNNMLIFLYRPSPQNPEPSLEAIILCYNCAIENIALQKKMFLEKTSDLTWVLVHQVYMTCIIMMWCLSCKRIRELHSRDEVAKHIETGMECLDFLVERWPGVGSAKEIFLRLSRVALESYDQDRDLPLFQQTLPNYVTDFNTHAHSEPETQSHSIFASSPPPVHTTIAHESPGSFRQYPSSPPMTPDIHANTSPKAKSISSVHTSPSITNATYSPRYQESAFSYPSPGHRSSLRHSYQADPSFQIEQQFPTYAESVSSLDARQPSMTIAQPALTSEHAGSISLNVLGPPSISNTTNFNLGSYSITSAPDIQNQGRIDLDASPGLAPHETMMCVADHPHQETQTQASLSIPALSSAASSLSHSALADSQATLFPNYPNPFFTMPHSGYQIYNNGTNLLNFQNQTLDNIPAIYGDYNADLLQQDQVNNLMDTLESDSHNNFPNMASNPFAVFY